MRTTLALGFFAMVGALNLKAGSAAAEPGEKGLLAWRAERTAELTKPTGWLSLIGLHFLQPGDNTIGSALDNQVILAQGPAHWGNVSVRADGKVTIVFAADLAAELDGKVAAGGDLHFGAEGKPTVASVGPTSFFVIERGGRKALRVRNTESTRRAHFLGIDYFPFDPSWRIEAQWVPFAEPRTVRIQNIIGNVSEEPIPGKAVFTREGKTYELWPMIEGPGEPLFFVISDQTSGQETYAAARFLYADLPKDGKVVLDFNRAQNPPCAFTPFATCPLPPSQNRMTLAVTAGEKNYRGEHP